MARAHRSVNPDSVYVFLRTLECYCIQRAERISGLQRSSFLVLIVALVELTQSIQR